MATTTNRDLVTSLPGVGERRRDLLAVRGILTVADLARASEADLAGMNWAVKLQELARRTPSATPSAAPAPPGRLLDGSASPRSNVKKASEEEQKPEGEPETECLITSHNWWQERVTLPKRRRQTAAPNERIPYRDAIVYELLVDPLNRVSFVCSWVRSRTGQGDVLCSLTYSPQLIAALNPHLPPLTVSIQPAEWDSWAQRHVLVHTLFETNAILERILHTYVANAVQLSPPTSPFPGLSPAAAAEALRLPASDEDE